MKLPTRLLPLAAMIAIARAHVGCHRACTHTSGGDDDDCIVYGTLRRDATLIPWPLANDKCLEQHESRGVRVTSVDVCSSPYDLANAFEPDGALYRWNTFTSTLYLGASQGGFFRTTRNNGVTVHNFKDAINIDGNIFDCVRSREACTSALRTYLTTDRNDATSEMGVLCAEINQQAAEDRKREQSAVRVLLCEQLQKSEAPPIDDWNGVTPSSVHGNCGNVVSAIQRVRSAYPDRDCATYGFGPGKQEIPKCAPTDGLEIVYGDKHRSAAFGSFRSPSLGGMLGLLLLLPTWALML